MKTKFFFLIIMAVMFCCASCKKEENKLPAADSNGNNNNGTVQSTPLSFSSLKAERTGIRLGETTTVTAEASGTNLSYHWSCSAGTLVGEGVSVTYGSTCNSCKGDNTVTCTVYDGKTSETKSIIISIR